MGSTLRDGLLPISKRGTHPETAGASAGEVFAAIAASATAAGFTLDDGQRMVARRLAGLGAQIVEHEALAVENAAPSPAADAAPDIVEVRAPDIAGESDSEVADADRPDASDASAAADSTVPRGLYLWGPAGRGKSWLLDAFYGAVPVDRKLRVHFHSFFNELHSRIFANRGSETVFANAVRELIGDAKLLLFDEFHVHDPGHATLLTALLRYALDHGITVVATSNYRPQGLLPSPVYHHIFEPGIELIERELDVVELPGEVDYRRSRADAVERRGFATGSWVHVPSFPSTQVDGADDADGADEQSSAAAGRAPDATRPAPAEATSLELGGRTFEVTAVRGRELWATFAELFIVQTSSLEFLQWARDFDTWHILDVPLLASVGRDPQQRFVNAVDVLVDYDIEAHFHADASFDEFVAAAAGRADAFRMVSRLHLLQR
ncbi:cell division protein ZapE [Pseudoclavibacter sp. RFBI5]|uniref:cell division protein ZapE n=1 Tax=Pseudoclavibacter sp. RFBI5 TaxID=2080578 RepID=UPI000CE785D2|nr:cell division protein ZapE [Pseudoclavibacter sp. RFBI5]PPG05603.1 cell division protein ZapE [Pseudoclavibacter sp. RFBI5]